MMEKNPDNNFMLIEADFKKFKFLNKNYGEIIGNNSLKQNRTVKHHGAENM